MFILWTSAFILYFGLQPNPCYLFLCSNLAIGKFFQVGSCLPLKNFHPFVYFNISEIYGTIRCFRFILCFSCSSPRIAQFFKETQHSFYSRMIFRNQDLGAWCAHCYWGAVYGLLADRDRYFIIYTNSHIPAYLYLFLYVSVCACMHVCVCVCVCVVYIIYIHINEFTQMFQTPIQYHRDNSNLSFSPVMRTRLPLSTSHLLIYSNPLYSFRIANL